MARQSSKVSDEFVLTSPEQVRTTRLLLPLFETSPFRGWQVDLGVRFLKWIARRKVPLNYKRTRPEESSGLPYVKWLRRDIRLESVVQVDDHQFVAPERLCIDCILDAERMGAMAMNYVMAKKIRRVGEDWEATLQFPSSGTASVRGRVLLNFAGVWVDRVNDLASGNKPIARKVVGVKGVSFAIQLPPECEGVGIAGNNAEGDAIMCVPWGKLHYVGPTETVYKGDIDDVKPEAEDIDHLIQDMNEFLPGLNMDRSKILYSWAGVRPITYDPERAKGRRMPFSVIHRLDREGLPNMLTITWAAIMFHRRAARRVVKEVKRLIPASRPSQPMKLSRRGAGPSPQDAFIADRPEISRADIVRCVRQEYAQDLVGVLFRRTGLGWNAAIPVSKVVEAAQLIAPELGWDQEEVDRQVKSYQAYASRQHLPSREPWSA